MQYRIAGRPCVNIAKHFELADEHFHLAGEIDILIGVELFYEILSIGRHILGDGLPILQRTKLGWVVAGSFAPNSNPNLPALSQQAKKRNQVRCNFTLNSQLHKFWEIEEYTGDSLTKSYSELSDDESECERIFMTHTRSADGNFVVNLPLRASISLLGQSKGIALRKFNALEKRFARDAQYKQMYTDFMNGFQQKGHMLKTDSNTEGFYNYLPHHAVVNPEKVSTPLRVVFNASMPTSTGVSLNDIQYKGTIKQEQLIDILLRFRMHKYVVNADVERMFTNIYLSPEQRHLQCILWRNEPTDEIETYVLTTLSFGLKSAPHIATRCLLQLSHETHALLKTSPTASSVTSAAAATAIESDFYLDDLITGGDDIEEVTKIVLEIDRILKGAKFILRKWKSNSTEIQGMISAKLNIHESCQYSQTSNIQLGDDSHKILGLEWSSHTDNLMYLIKTQSKLHNVTKRNILSRVSSVFDPLGLIGPVLVVAKCLIQKLWLDKAEWDQRVPENLFKQWETFYDGLQKLHNIQIPRHVIIRDYKIVELHGFSDSSVAAYGAAIYVRSVDREGKVQTRLLMAKSRVAPIKQKTIPRLELCAAHLLAETMNKVKNALKCQITGIKYWSDSSIVLAWIKTEPYKLNSFVANRVSKIRNLTNITEWNWVPSFDNPADILSRGTTAEKLVSSKLWWEGPLWLCKPSEEWPKFTGRNQDDKLPELKHTNVTRCHLSHTQSNHSVVQKLLSQWSDITKIVRIFAYIRRYIYNCGHKNAKVTGWLTTSEIIKSMESLVKCAQIDSFPIEYELLQNKQDLPKNSKLASLKPFYENGVIRIGGRIGLSHYNFDKKHPLLLHSTHILTKLIMIREHQRLLHAGAQLLLSSVRERFWPIKGKILANKIVRECVTCFRAKPNTTEPVMGDLPNSRVNPSPPFYTSGLDYAGPFILRDRRGRGYTTYKSYIGIFVCFATKAVHFELITSLRTEAFLAALRRFSARRGVPREIVSDNGTTFKGASSDLKELYDFVKNYTADLTTTCANQGIDWKFIPVYTPHMAGLAEAAVKSCKHHLKRVLGQSLLTYEEFSTILIQIESILNSRPLCPIPLAETQDIQVLTPAHFLIGRTPVSLPDYEYHDVPTNRLNHYQHLQQMQQGFWKRWSRDYIGLLQERTKWRSSRGPRLAEGTIVVIKDDRLPPCQWSLARIVKVHAGHDGIVRVATMKTNRGIIKRSFNNICPLPIEDNL
uniref:Integrase catalytic domain-containing protein n=1 Tax=Heliothis virescens TaxID=7102 RepID=A0A2A4IUY1_HELVI